MLAEKLVNQAQANPEQWFGDGQHEDEILFANGVFTVGSNGDCEDFESAKDALAALQSSWERENR